MGTGTGGVPAEGLLHAVAGSLAKDGRVATRTRGGAKPP
jgi:hypothetical protein